MRGQTTLDFAIGISIFLAVIITIFSFAPGILTPFTVTGQSDAVTVDRTADYLVQDALGSPEQPYKLDRSCTVAFFDRSADEYPDDPFGDDCRYENETLTNQTGLPPTATVNITILGNTSENGQVLDQLYWDTSTRTLTEIPGGNTTLAIGDEVEPQRSTTTATRVVTLHEQDVVVRVVVS